MPRRIAVWALALPAAASLSADAALDAAPAAPHQRIELRFENAGLSLAGSLLLPSGKNLPAAVLIHGSGASDRSNRWAHSIADALVRCGVAVLIPDKRGSGASEGDWRTADFEDLAADARAGFERLRAHAAIDPARTGYLGLSQGGHVAPLAAARGPRAAFAVSMVGSVQVMEQQLYDELELAYRRYRLDEATISWLQEFARMSFDYIRTGKGFDRYLERHQEITSSPFAGAAETWPISEDDPYWAFWRGVYDYDPIPWWRRIVGLGVRVLFVYGADDENVNVSASAARIAEELPAGAFTLRIYQGAGHSLRDAAKAGLRADVVEDTCRWLQEIPRVSSHDQTRDWRRRAKSSIANRR